MYWAEVNLQIEETKRVVRGLAITPARLAATFL